MHLQPAHLPLGREKESSIICSMFWMKWPCLVIIMIMILFLSSIQFTVQIKHMPSRGHVVVLSKRLCYILHRYHTFWNFTLSSLATPKSLGTVSSVSSGAEEQGRQIEIPCHIIPHWWKPKLIKTERNIIQKTTEKTHN